MTEFELNKAIAEKLGFKVKVRKTIDYKGDPFFRYEIIEKSRARLLPDYCNNWNDLMPLVVEHLSQLQAAECFYDENPQRALAECLLKVLTATQAG